MFQNYRKKLFQLVVQFFLLGIFFSTFSQSTIDVRQFNKHALIYSNNGKKGLKIKNKSVIEPLYDSLFYFKKNYAKVYQNGLCGIYQLNQSIVVPSLFDSLQLVNDSLVFTSLYEKKGLISLQNRVLLKPIYKSIQMNGYGNTIVENFKQIIIHTPLKNDTLLGDSLVEDLYGYIVHYNNYKEKIKKGDVVIPSKSNKSYEVRVPSSMEKHALLKFDTLYPSQFSKLTNDSLLLKNATKIVYWGDTLLVFSNGIKYGVASIHATYITLNLYDEISPLNKRFLKFRIGSVWGIMNNSGIWQTDTLYECLQNYPSHQFCKVSLADKQGVVGYNGRTIVPARYDYIKYEKSEDILTLSNQGNYLAIIDTNGIQLLDTNYQYQEIGKFVNGFARVKKFNKYGFINKRGGLTIATQYVKTSENVVAERAAVYIKNKWALVDSWEKLLAQPFYDSIGVFKDSVVIAVKNKKWLLLDYFGKEICTAKFDAISTYNTQYFIVNRGGKYGVMKKDGNEIIYTKYDKIVAINPFFVVVKEFEKYGLLDRKGMRLEDSEFDTISLLNATKSYVTIKNISRNILKF